MKPETNTTTTKPAVLLLPAVTATRQTRIEQAHARHTISTAGTWTATPEGIRPPIHRQSPAQLYRTADTAVYLALRARHQSSGLHLFGILTAQAGADRTNRTIEAVATQAIEAERERDKLRATQHYHEAQADRKTLTPAEKNAHRAKANQARKQADKLTAKADSLNRIIKDSTASDRLPLVQEAILEALTHDPADPDGIFPAMCRRAGKAIADIASPDSATATRTKVTEITPDEAERIRKAYPDKVLIDPATGLEYVTPCHIPHNVKGATSQCYDTIEYRKRGRGENARWTWCKVSHYLTIAPYISYEQFTEASGGDTAEIATNGGINAIGTQEDAHAIIDLLNRANLTEREQTIVYMVADQTSARHGQQAVNEYWKERTPQIQALKTTKARREAHKDAQRTADNKRIGAQWDNAMERNGITSKGNRDTIKSRIRAKLEGATKPAEPMTKEEQEERTARRWASMQRNTARGHATDNSPRPDMVTIWTTAPAVLLTRTAPNGDKTTTTAHVDRNPAPVIIWTESGHAPEAINPGEDIRTAEVMNRDSYRQTAPKATPPAMTERERKQWEKLCKSEAEVIALWRKFEAMNGRTPDTSPANLTKANTTSAEARAEAERMRKASAHLTKVKDR